MSQFVVSARKYRPQRFEDVVGQGHVSKTLKNALQSEQLAHAFLFCGPRGVGKTTCARILAKVLNCEQRTPDFEACNTCSSCKSFNENASFNIHELDAASNNSVEHIRGLIEQVRFQPQQGRYKIFIIDEVHMLSTQAFNAFLKTLEEPPSYAIFILATTEKHKIIPTILSRCQIFDFKRIQIADTVAHLQDICRQENIPAEAEALHIISQKSDGALRDALSIFDRMVSFGAGRITYDQVIENLNVLDYDYYFRVVDAMLAEDTATNLLIFDQVFKKGFEPDIFMSGLADHLRNLLVCKDAETLQLLDVSEGLATRYQQQATQAPSSFLLTALNIAADCDVHYKMARHKRLHVELALLKMTYINRAITLAKNTPLVSGIEKKTPELTQSEPKAVKPTEAPPSNPPSPKETPVATATTATMAASEAPKSTAPIDNGKPTLKNKNTKFDLPSLNNMMVMEPNGHSLNTKKEAAKLEETTLKAAWEAFIPTINSPVVQQSFLKAILKIKLPNMVIVEVGSQMAKGMIQQESEMIVFLRKQLGIPELGLEIQVDLEKAKDLVVTKKILSIREKYDLLREKNPLVHELKRRLDLEPDNEV